MKLKRILAGVTACTIVGSTMLAMPASATTTTAAKDVKIFDVMNAAKTIAEMDVSDDVKSTLLDKFDTNGNGKIDMTELIAMAQRVAKLNDQDIVNEYGTADETTTTEETTGETTVETTVSTDETTETTLETTVSTDETTETTVETSETSEETTETTLETTETTEETTTTTAALEPTVAIGDNEYEDGDTVVVEEGTDVYSVSVSDENYDVEVALEGSKDADGKDAVRVNGTNFVCNSDGKLTITVTVPDTDLKKVITLNVKKVKTIESEVKNLVIGYNSGNGAVYSDEYKSFSEGIQQDIYNDNAVIDPEEADEYWAELEGKAGKFANAKDCTNSKANKEITVSVRGTATIAGFFNTDDNGDFVKYDTTDTVTYMSTDSNSVDVDANGTITGIKETTSQVQVLVIVGGKSVTSFYVTVIEDPSATATIVEASGSTYVKDSSNGSYDYAVEGKYVANVSAGSVPSYNSLKDAVGEENIKSVTFKNADGSAIKNLEVYNNYYEGGSIIYFVNSTTGTVYYAITNVEGTGEVYTNYGCVMVLDMEQAKATAVLPTGALTVNVNGVKAVATADSKNVTADKTVYVTEGTTFTLSDIVKVQGVTNPTVTVENSDKGADTQNVSYDALTKTFTVNELTDKNSGDANEETITFTYEVSKTDKRTVKVTFVTVKPALKVTSVYGIDKNDIDIDGGTYYVAKDKLIDPKAAPVYVNSVDEDGNIDIANVIAATEYKVTSSDEKKVTVGTDGKTLAYATGYAKTAKAGDTVTLTYTFEQGQTVSYTIEVVDAMPTVAQNSMVDDFFKYTDKTGTGYQANVTFTGLVKASNIPDGAELVVNVVKDGTSNNVTYMNGTTQENKTGYTVSAVDIALESAGNNSYTITGIAVGSQDKVAENTTIAFEVSVVDADGNVITTPEKIVVTINPTDETAEVPEITLPSAELTTANTVAEYNYTVTDGWTLTNAETKDADGNTVKVVNGKITLTLAKAYINKAEASTTATLTFVKGNVTKTKDVTLKYTGVVEVAPKIELAATEATLDAETNKVATYTISTEDLKDWTVTGTSTVGTVAVEGKTITLTLTDAYAETTPANADIVLTLKKAGQNDATQTINVTYVAPTVAP